MTYTRSDFNKLKNQQPEFTDAPLNHIAKTVLMVLATLAFLLVLGLVGRADRQTQLEEAMQNTCTASDQEVGRWAHECQTLIKQVQSDGHHEVISDGTGKYWTETK